MSMTDVVSLAGESGWQKATAGGSMTRIACGRLVGPNRICADQLHLSPDRESPSLERAPASVPQRQMGTVRNGVKSDIR